MQTILRAAPTAIASALLIGLVALAGSSRALAQGAPNIPPPPPPVGSLVVPNVGPQSLGVDHFRSPNRRRGTTTTRTRPTAVNPRVNRQKAKRPKAQRRRAARRRTPRPPVFALGSPPPIPVRAPLADRRPREVLVLLKDGGSDILANTIANRYGLVRLEAQRIGLLNAQLHKFQFGEDRNLEDVIRSLDGDADVDMVQSNQLYHPLGPTEATQSPSNQYALTKLGVEPAHRLAKGRDIAVAVIDTAVDTSHPALAASVAKSFDAVKDGKAKPHAHGTAIAGVISAQGKIRGVAPMARLLAVRAFYPHPRRKTPETSSYILLRALDWSVDNGARIINMSFAGPADPLVKQALDAAVERGMVLVAAAGNGGPDAPPAYPAAYKSVIAITALDHKDRLYKRANQGAYVSVAAPGVDVLVTALAKRYGYASGTSLAAAHVSGQVALMMERDPAASVAHITKTILGTAHDLGPKGHDKQFGAGRADVHASLQALTAR